MTKKEQKAYDLCAEIKSRGEGWIAIHWIKTASGRQAVIRNDRDQVVSRTTGSGYDKESKALAGALRFIAQSNRVWASGGCGFYEVAKAMHMEGWVLRKVIDQPKLSVYHVEK